MQRVSMRIFIIMNEFHTKLVKPLSSHMSDLISLDFQKSRYSSRYTLLFAELTMSVTISNKHLATSFTYPSQWDPRYQHIKLITSRNFLYSRISHFSHLWTSLALLLCSQASNNCCFLNNNCCSESNLHSGGRHCCLFRNMYVKVHVVHIYSARHIFL